MTAKQTDAEIVEEMRVFYQAKLNEACAAYDEGSTVPEYFAAQSLPQERYVVADRDLRELGHFDIVPPENRPMPKALRRQWVYEHRENGKLFVIGFENRLRLQTLGYAELHALVDDGTREN